MLISVCRSQVNPPESSYEGLKGTHHMQGGVTLPAGNARFLPLVYKLHLKYLKPAEHFMCFTSLDVSKEAFFSIKYLLSDWVHSTVLCILGSIKII